MEKDLEKKFKDFLELLLEHLEEISIEAEELYNEIVDNELFD